MNGEIRPISSLLIALLGPIIWAAHFFGVYLVEAVLCPAREPVSIGLVGLALSALALAALTLHSARCHLSDPAGGARDPLRFTLPLTLLSMTAVVWTSLPLLVLPACTPGGSG